MVSRNKNVVEVQERGPIGLIIIYPSVNRELFGKFNDSFPYTISSTNSFSMYL